MINSRTLYIFRDGKFTKVISQPWPLWRELPSLRKHSCCRNILSGRPDRFYFQEPGPRVLRTARQIPVREPLSYPPAETSQIHVGVPVVFISGRYGAIFRSSAASIFAKSSRFQSINLSSFLYVISYIIKLVKLRRRISNSVMIYLLRYLLKNSVMLSNGILSMRSYKSTWVASFTIRSSLG